MLSPGGRDARESAIGDDKPYHGNTLRTMGAQGGSTAARRILCGAGRAFGPGDHRGRPASRQGTIADSMITGHESFDAPSRRSTNVIGTSAHRKPAREASQALSLIHISEPTRL